MQPKWTWKDPDLPRLYDEFGQNRINKAAKQMKTPLHQIEPTHRDNPIFASIVNCKDVRTITNLTFDFVEADADQTMMRTKERQAVMECGLRKLLELCNKQSVNQMRWIGEHNEDMHCDHALLKRTLLHIEQQSKCLDAVFRLQNQQLKESNAKRQGKRLQNLSYRNDKDQVGSADGFSKGVAFEKVVSASCGEVKRGGSSQNRGCEVASLGLQFLSIMLSPTGGDAATQKQRRLIYRDAFFNNRAAEVISIVLEEQGTV